MGYIKISCPSCGANIELDDSREFGFCSFCGTKITQDKIVVEHRGSVKINGVANTKSLLDRAKLFLEDQKFNEAYQYCERALDIEPQNPEAYLIRLMAETRCCRLESLAYHTKPLDTYDSYNKAIRFASPEMQNELSRYNKIIKEKVADKEKQWQAEIEKKELELQPQRKHLDELREKARKTSFWIKRRKLFNTILIIVNIVVLLSKFSWNRFCILAIEFAVIWFILWLLEKRALQNAKNASNYDKTVYSKTFDELYYDKKAYDKWSNEMKKNY